MRISPNKITDLAPDEIFVFGSNIAGQHGGGAARTAYEKFGAQWGVGVGPAGKTYAIPTMQGDAKTVRPYVDEFIEYARRNPGMKFLVTEIGCGIAGFTPQEMAPLFRGAADMENVYLPHRFLEVLDRQGADCSGTHENPPQSR